MTVPPPPPTANKDALTKASLIDTELVQVPDLTLLRLAFQVSCEALPIEQRQQAGSDLLTRIRQNDMLPYERFLRERCVGDAGRLLPALTSQEATQMASRAEADLQALDKQYEDAVANLGKSDQFEVRVAQAMKLCRLGDKDKAVLALRVVEDEAATIGVKLDVVFALLRLGFLFHDHDLLSRNIQKAESYLEQGGDWDRRNRLKTYKGLFALLRRDMGEAAKYLLDTLATFTYTELMPYATFVRYTVLCCMIALPRPELKAKVLHAPEVLEVIDETPALREFLYALYECRYADFFKALAVMEEQGSVDVWLAPHIRFYVKEMRILAYRQLLSSYASVTLSSMAAAFGVSEAFLDDELARWIASGRLDAVVDKVQGIVMTTQRPHSKQAHYVAFMKQGDALLDRVQKLSRMIHS